MLEDVRHLQRDSLDQAFGVLCEFLVGGRGWSLLGAYLKHLLDLLQGVDAPYRIVAEDAGYCHRDVLGRRILPFLRLVVRTADKPTSLTVGLEDIVHG